MNPPGSLPPPPSLPGPPMGAPSLPDRMFKDRSGAGAGGRGPMAPSTERSPASVDSNDVDANPSDPHDASVDNEITAFRIPDVEYPNLSSQALFGLMLFGGTMLAIYGVIFITILIFARLPVISGMVVFAVVTLVIGAIVLYLYTTWAATAERLNKAISVYVPRLLTGQESSAADLSSASASAVGRGAESASASRRPGRGGESRQGGASQLRKRNKAFL